MSKHPDDLADLVFNRVATVYDHAAEAGRHEQAVPHDWRVRDEGCAFVDTLPQALIRNSTYSETGS